jgi:hypothetical protein
MEGFGWRPSKLNGGRSKESEGKLLRSRFSVWLEPVAVAK